MMRLCAVRDVPEGGTRRVKLEGHSAIAVYNVGGRIHATADRCTHAGGSLSSGVVTGDTIECPLHGCRFRIATGEPLEPPCVVPLRSYAVNVMGEDVMAELSPQRMK